MMVNLIVAICMLSQVGHNFKSKQRLAILTLGMMALSVLENSGHGRREQSFF